MSMFPSIGVSGSGLVVDSAWLDALAGNISNSNDYTTPGKPVFRPQEVVVAPQAESNVAVPGSQAASDALGVAVQSVQYSGNPQGVLKYDPQNPLSNAAGMIAYPDVSIGHELVSLVDAQTSFQANANALQNSSDAYKAILNIKS